jgi:hypothetical protein
MKGSKPVQLGGNFRKRLWIGSGRPGNQPEDWPEWSGPWAFVCQGLYQAPRSARWVPGVAHPPGIPLAVPGDIQMVFRNIDADRDFRGHVHDRCHPLYNGKCPCYEDTVFEDPRTVRAERKEDTAILVAARSSRPADRRSAVSSLILPADRAAPGGAGPPKQKGRVPRISWFARAARRLSFIVGHPCAPGGSSCKIRIDQIREPDGVLAVYHPEPASKVYPVVNRRMWT